MFNVIRRSQRSGKTSKSAAPALFSVALLAFMLAMTLLPLATPGVAAKDDDPILTIPGGLNGPILQQETPVSEIDIDVDTPVIDVTEAGDGGEGREATDPTADEQPVEDAGEDPADGNEIPDLLATPEPGDGDEAYPHVVGIYKHACPVGFDAYQADFAALDANCGDGMPGSPSTWWLGIRWSAPRRRSPSRTRTTPAPCLGSSETAATRLSSRCRRGTARRSSSARDRR
jgi:hypothetical protein